MKSIKTFFLRFKNSIGSLLLGFLLTATLVATAFIYYEERSRITKTSDHNFLLRTLRSIDEKSTDVRLLARGPRSGHEDIILLTVDEKSIATVGRWPWPRDITGKAIDKAVELGMKVISFDMVFSEPSINEANQFYQGIKNRVPLNAQSKQLIERDIKRFDKDKALQKYLEKNASNLVFGTVFETSTHGLATVAPYTDRCHHFIFENTDAYKIWDNDETIIATFEEFEPLFPDALAELYSSHIRSIEQSVRQQSPKPKNATEALNLKYEVINAQFRYCDNFLDPKNDELYDAISEAWPMILEEEDSEELSQYPTFESWIRGEMEPSLANQVPQAEDWLMNTALISSGALHTGFFNAQLDMDGTIRNSRILIRTGNKYMPSIALKAYLLANDYNASVHFSEDPKLQGTKRISKLEISDNNTGDPVTTIPISSDGVMKINYAGKEKMFAYFSMSDLLTDSEYATIEQRKRNPKTKKWEVEKVKVKKAEYLKGKMAILGVTAIGVFDLRVTPFEENYPGAETHVNVLDNLIRGDFLYESKLEEPIMLITLFFMGLILTLALSQLGAISGLLLTLASMAAVVFIEKIYFFEEGLVISVIFPLLLVSSTYVLLTFFKYFIEERNKKELRSTFQKYVSPAIVDEILKSPENLELGGKKENVTVLFSDIRGFTTISERLDPRALSDLLNSYLTPMTDLVFQNQGTLDKYMGDAIMAFFGAPLHSPDHPKHACRCSLEMLVKLKELQAVYREQGLPEIDVGIGLNTGECSVGNMGSETVRSYTVMGDAVNLGSRLEAINKQYGTRIIISEFTHELVKDSFACREVDLVKVKGKDLPVKIYELVEEGALSGSLKDKVDRFKEGYSLYHQKQFESALKSFNGALEIDPTDKCSTLYIERCQNFIETPPPADWDGVFTMTTK